MKTEDAAIRRANLAQLCKQRGWTAKDLHQAMDPDSRYTFWRDLLADPKKSFGEKVARRIEAHLELGRGWLDEERAALPRGHVRTSEPAASYGAGAHRWPFSVALLAALNRCQPPQLLVLENTLRVQLGMAPLPATAKRRRA